MERAKAIWEELGLPKLKPESPWYGYSLGEWPDDLERAAAMAVKGDYFETGKLLAKRRRQDVGTSTPAPQLPHRPPGQGADEARHGVGGRCGPCERHGVVRLPARASGR